MPDAGNVCELDIIFNFHKAYYLLDELVMGGELQETNKKEVRLPCFPRALHRNTSPRTPSYSRQCSSPGQWLSAF